MSRNHFLIALLSLAALGCRDTTGPGCGGVCRFPRLGIVVSGSVVPPDGRGVAAIVHLTFLETGFPARDTLDRCIGNVIRDTVVFTNPGSRFNVLLVPGFPNFQGCLVLRATPDATSGLQPGVVSFPGLQLRDTSAHDTLHATIPIRP